MGKNVEYTSDPDAFLDKQAPRARELFNAAMKGDEVAAERLHGLPEVIVSPPARPEIAQMYRRLSEILEELGR